jgi:uncharacterized membrane protein YwaF
MNICVSRFLGGGSALFRRCLKKFRAGASRLIVILAGVGIYGVMAYLVDQRVGEIGIRMALGASSTNVLKVIVFDGSRPSFRGQPLE